jgi:ATP-dependent Lon protease
VRLSGYSEEEKLQIARRYLIPRQVREAGLDAERFMLPDDAVRRVIASYTREAGVRQLERAIGQLARKAAVRFARGETAAVTVRPEDLPAMMGRERFHEDRARVALQPGVATGLAWTETGGEVLYVEAVLLPEGKDLMLTGQLGAVMKESAQAARSYVWAQAEALGISLDTLRSNGLHIHVPAGAIPKDGPSAGVAMASAIVSAYTRLPTRKDTAMTGEITLSGLVLPVGGVKEKVLAARRAGIKRVVLPKDNEQDLTELPDDVRAEIEFLPVERIEDALHQTIAELADQFSPTSG